MKGTRMNYQPTHIQIRDFAFKSLAPGIKNRSDETAQETFLNGILINQFLFI